MKSDFSLLTGDRPPLSIFTYRLIRRRCFEPFPDLRVSYFIDSPRAQEEFLTVDELHRPCAVKASDRE
ncbi:hypothetical protein GCM10009786_26800 [Leucobacter alluvii]|uniref:Uncharacterized protein n=1 Tax=Leucobacter alluvii TaxID=340321 RepID=A0ABN3B8Q0_9MICO